MSGTGQLFNIDLGAGNDIVNVTGGKIFNSGTGAIILGLGSDILTMSGGTISDYIDFGTTDIVSNTFTLSGGAVAGQVTFGNAADTLTMSGGSIVGNIGFKDGADVMTMTGGSINGNIDFGSTDTVGNTFNHTGGAIKTNLIVFGGGADIFNNTGGTFSTTGYIDLGDGADHFNGGASKEKVIDNGGADVIKLAAGDDIYLAVKVGGTGADGADIINGGLGVDIYDASNATSSVFINLDSVAHLFAANSATGVDTGTDTILNFENVFGGSGSDSIIGSNADNVIFGGGGAADNLQGLGGNDRLVAGSGADVLTGGAGADSLTGGAGNDVFIYTKISDSGITAATRDTIQDFTQGQDKIDLSAINAIAGTANSAFTLIGLQNFHHVAGELRESLTVAGTVVKGDVNGDGVADFAILLKGNFFLAGGDFIL